jgi:hypothetical protein
MLLALLGVWRVHVLLCLSLFLVTGCCLHQSHIMSIVLHTSSPQENVNSVNKEFEATYTFEDQIEVTTTRTNRLPNTSLHVLEEIDAEENIVDRLDLWARIREYDQRMADEGFTQVLTKAQKQTRKKLALGKSYQTRAKGALPSSK